MSIDNTAQLTLFSLILMRMSGFILMNPILGRNNIPVRVKGGFIFILTMTVYSASMEEAIEIASTVEFGFLLFKEFAAGYVIGYVMHLFFFIVSFAGYVIDYQIGLSMATVYDPQSNAQMPVTGSVYQAWLIMLFFAVDGHLALMKILLTSAEIVPYGGPRARTDRERHSRRPEEMRHRYRRRIRRSQAKHRPASRRQPRNRTGHRIRIRR